MWVFDRKVVQIRESEEKVTHDKYLKPEYFMRTFNFGKNV